MGNLRLANLEPLAKLYVYCAPCMRQISTAFDLCKSRSCYTLFFEYFIRVDDRLPSSCCGGLDDIQKCVSFIEQLKQIEANRNWRNIWETTTMIDRVWMEQRIYDVKEEYRPPVSHHITDAIRYIFADGRAYQDRCGAIVVIGEADFISQVMNHPPFPRKPNMAEASEIYWKEQSWTRNKSSWDRKYLGTYTRNIQPKLDPPALARTPAPPPMSFTAEDPSSPVSEPAAKRLKSSSVTTED